MKISSVFVRSRSECVCDLRLRLEAMPGVKVLAAAEDGRFALRVEDSESATAADTFLKVSDLPGVLSASLSYQSCDDGLGAVE